MEVQMKQQKSLLVKIGIMIIGLATFASALTIGYSNPNFDDNFLTIQREAARKYARKLGHKIQIEDAREDVGTQLSHIQNFIASKVDAIIVTPVSTDATPRITRLAAQARIPLVYVNRLPSDFAKLGNKSAYVGSDETWSGTLEAFELCKLSSGTGNAVILVGLLENEAAQTRTKDVEEVLKLSMCKGIKVVGKQEAKWQRTMANDIVANWLSKGTKIDIVFANNDEMAIGAIQAMKNAGINMKDVLIGGVDATSDALRAMKAGDLDVTVFQNAAGQATGGIDAAIALVKGKKIPKFINIPFELVTPANMKDYMGAN